MATGSEQQEDSLRGTARLVGLTRPHGPVCSKARRQNGVWFTKDTVTSTLSWLVGTLLADKLQNWNSTLLESEPEPQSGPHV